MNGSIVNNSQWRLVHKQTPTDIPPEDALHTLLRVSTLGIANLTLLSVHTPARSQLGEQELRQVLGLPVHPPTDLGQVGKHGLLRSLPSPEAGPR